MRTLNVYVPYVYSTRVQIAHYPTQTEKILSNTVTSCALIMHMLRVYYLLQKGKLRQRKQIYPLYVAYI